MVLTIVMMAASMSVAPSAGQSSVEEPKHSEALSDKPDKSAREDYAAKRFQAQRFVEAAVEFESLWEEFADSRHLYNAALARQGAGHLAHAYAYLGEFLAGGDAQSIPEATVAALRDHLRAQLVPVEVEVVGKSSEVTFVRLGGFPSEGRDRPINIPVSRKHQAVYLDPGIWQVQARRSKRKSSVKTITVTSDVPGSVKLRMSRKPGGNGDGVGVGKWQVTAINAGVGAGLGIAGAVVWSENQKKVDDSLSVTPDCGSVSLEKIDCKRHYRGLNKYSSLTAAGAGLSGAGAGWIVSGLASLLPKRRQRYIANIAQVSLGTGFVVAGAISAGFALDDREGVISRLETPPPETASEAMIAEGWHQRFVGYSLLTGVGAGLVVGSLTSIALEKMFQRSRARDVAHAHPVLLGGSTQGIAIRGRF